jgi:hypothetical protein
MAISENPEIETFLHQLAYWRDALHKAIDGGTGTKRIECIKEANKHMTTMLQLLRNPQTAAQIDHLLQEIQRNSESSENAREAERILQSEQKRFIDYEKKLNYILKLNPKEWRMVVTDGRKLLNRRRVLVDV